MRRISVVVILSLVALSSYAQPAQRPDPLIQAQRQPPAFQNQNRCCPRVYDATGKLVGDMIRWDDRFQSIPLHAYVRYPIAGGGDVALHVAPEAISGTQGPGGSVALFTTPDCSGNSMFAMLGWPPAMKRYGMVLPVSAPGMSGFAATQAWLWVTNVTPTRVSPGATVFHSQWGDNGACVPYPAPGYTVTGNPFGGFWMTRVEDLYKKYKRPFYVE